MPTARTLTHTVKLALGGLLNTIGGAVTSRLDRTISEAVAQSLLNQEIGRLHDQVRILTPTNPCLKGFKVYSQFDEDGIIDDILSRIGEGVRVFVEIGCGNGLQNNTHFLLHKGWRGAWIDGGAENIRFIAEYIPLRSTRLIVTKALATAENVHTLIRETKTYFRTDGLDVLSLDIDGNELFVLRALVADTPPRVICVEYNAKFPPPLLVSMAYDERHVWRQDDYHGASLQALVDALPGYRLVSCNLSGTNAFFVRRDLAQPFDDYDVTTLYQPPRYHLLRVTSGHPASLKFLTNLMAERTVS